LLPKLYKNIAQYFALNSIMGFLEVYEQIVYCVNVCLFSSEYYEYKNVINSGSVMWKPTITILIISSMYGLNLQMTMLDKVLNKGDSRDIP
jgi:hypothetical protein